MRDVGEKQKLAGGNPNGAFTPGESLADDFHLGIGRHERVERGIETLDAAHCLTWFVVRKDNIAGCADATGREDDFCKVTS